MSGLFKTPKYPPPPQMAATDAALDERERRAEDREKKELRKTSASSRARRKSARLLYSQDRKAPALGVGTNLAGNESIRNPYEDERRIT